MSKKQTPLQELRDAYSRKLKHIETVIQNNTNNGSLLDQRRAERLNTKAGEYRAMITDIERLLPAEREAIEQAYVSGKIEMTKDRNPHNKITAQEYFDQTYEQ
jgi:hypothetical protein